MSISMKQFGSNEQLSESRVSSGSRGPVFPYRLQCRACGFEPVDAMTSPRRCPKCDGRAWERFTVPRSLLMCADQRAAEAQRQASVVGR
jgi:predicted Zn-ribbon and HTH transcriptional regulator